jgi:hypothetical protein
MLFSCNVVVHPTLHIHCFRFFYSDKDASHSVQRPPNVHDWCLLMDRSRHCFPTEYNEPLLSSSISTDRRFLFLSVSVNFKKVWGFKNFKSKTVARGMISQTSPSGSFFVLRFRVLSSINLSPAWLVDRFLCLWGYKGTLISRLFGQI